MLPTPKAAIVFAIVVQGIVVQEPVCTALPFRRLLYSDSAIVAHVSVFLRPVFPEARGRRRGDRRDVFSYCL